MFSSLFGKKKTEQKPKTPSILGLRIGCSFELDSLMLKLIQDDLIIDQAATTHIIQAAGLVELDGTHIFRFYTDDEAFLQIVAQGGTDDSNVIDVKLFHYYKTVDISNEADWKNLLNTKLGTPQYSIEGYTYNRVWESLNEYHQPIHMREHTYEEDGLPSMTDQFTMLFERPVSNDQMESLFLSAEETLDEHQQFHRCLVISTGMSLGPSEITIHG